MTNKWILWAGTAALFSLSIAGAKTYDLTFSAPTKIGSVQLSQGTYRLKVEGSEAVFTNTRDGKSVSTAATVENENQKFGTTAVESVKDTGGDRVTAIELQGTRTKLVFNR